MVVISPQWGHQTLCKTRSWKCEGIAFQNSTVLLACWLVLPLFFLFRSPIRRIDARSIPMLGCGSSRLSSSRTTHAQADPARAETRSHERTRAHQPSAEGNLSRMVKQEWIRHVLASVSPDETVARSLRSPIERYAPETFSSLIHRLFCE
jgi:hypothetical protein